MGIGRELGWCGMYLQREVEPAALRWRRVMICTHPRRSLVSRVVKEEREVQELKGGG